MQSMYSRMLVSLLCGLIAMNVYLNAFAPSTLDQRTLIQVVALGICIYWLVFSVLNRIARSLPNKKR